VESAFETAHEAIAHADHLHLGAWQRRFRVWTVSLLWALGRPRPAREVIDELVAERLPPGDLDVLEPYAVQTLTDLGLFDDARNVLNRLRARAASDQESLGEALWAQADLELWAGRAHEALDVVLEYEERFAGLNVSETPRLVELTGAWARFELGLPPVPAVFAQRYALTAGSEPELQALDALAAGDPAEAATLFGQAALAWRGRNTRSELRSLWAEGESLGLAGRTGQARSRLEHVERLAEDAGYVAVVARVERSLRRVGVRRSAPRAPAGELSEREREILALVARGLSNAQIARQLGLSRATISDHIADASSKLGARNRAQAAALSARR
jgi:DNA-binding CsgD family transcriptional regulator